jgi:hypothetical protein
MTLWAAGGRKQGFLPQLIVDSSGIKRAQGHNFRVSGHQLPGQEKENTTT